MLTAERFGQLIHIAVHQADHRHHDTRALLRVGGTPSNLSFCGVLDGFGHFGRGCQRQFGLNLARCRIVHVAKLARGSFDLCTVYEMRQLLHDISP